MKSSLLYLTLICIIFAGCQKEANRKALKAYFNYEVNGKRIMIEDEILLEDNTFECTVMGDSVMYIHATRVYEGAGFIIKIKEGGGKDGTYALDSNSKGFYENPADKRIYYTNDTHKGTVTLQNGTFQAKTMLNTVKGTFEFEGVDVTTNKSFKITNGEFFMERKRK